MELESALLSFIRRKKVFDKFARTMDESFFDNLYCRRIFNAVKEYFTRYPDKEMVSKRNLKILVNGEGEDKKVLFELIAGLDHDVDPDLMNDQMRTFIREGILRNALRKEVPALEGKRQFNVEMITEALRAARELELKSDSLYDYVTETQAFHKTFMQAGTSIPTGILQLDEALRIPPTTGEEWVIMGPPGRGKTQMLLNLVVNAAKQGFTALYVTAGDQGLVRVSRRLDSLVSGIPWHRVESESDRALGLLAKRLKHNVVQKGGKILIQDWSDSSCTPSQVEALLTTVDVDLVAVDYPDIMRPDKYYSERRHEIGSIFDALRKVAVKRGVLMWCGSQANRSSLDRNKITMKDVAEDITKCWVADGVITFNQTTEEHEEGLGRFFVAKARRPPLKEYEIKFMIDTETGVIA